MDAIRISKTSCQFPSDYTAHISEEVILKLMTPKSHLRLLKQNMFHLIWTPSLGDKSVSLHSSAWILSRTVNSEARQSCWTNSPRAWRRQVDDTISISIIDICTVLQLSQAQWLMASSYNWRYTLHRIPNCSCLRLQGKTSQGKTMNITSFTSHPFVNGSKR